MTGTLADGMKPRGRVEIFTTRGAPTLKLGKQLPSKGGVKRYESAEIIFDGVEVLDTKCIENIIVSYGKNAVINALVNGSTDIIGRMAIGDRGTLPSDPSVPKVPTSDFTSLYHEIYRDDCDAVVPTTTNTVHEAKFIKTFNAVSIPASAFSNQTNPVVNEVGLVTFDEGSGPLPREPVAYPDAPMADENLFSIRTFKSVPFEASNEISVTIRYTIFIA